MSTLNEVIPRFVRGWLIDIGCGEKPLKEMLSNYVVSHVGIDTQETLHDKSKIDVFATADKLPMREESFDSAICFAVLEHLKEPARAVAETYRVLKTGGHAIYTVPFIWHLHEEPHDYYRFSKYGLRYLFEKTGFEIVELKALSGFWVTFGQLLVYKLQLLNRGPVRWLRVVDAVGLLIQAVACGLDRIDRAEKWTWMYMVVARKNEGNYSAERDPANEDECQPRKVS